MRRAPAFAGLAASHWLGRPVGLAERVAFRIMTFGPPRKRSVTIAGHETSVSLEPMFWQLLEQAVVERGMPLSGLIAEIDAERLSWRPTPNLTSALRQWLLRYALDRGPH